MEKKMAQDDIKNEINEHQMNNVAKRNRRKRKKRLNKMKNL